jgi:hypothetical protein
VPVVLLLPLLMLLLLLLPSPLRCSERCSLGVFSRLRYHEQGND